MDNIITFENNKYEWKDIPTYGKCLVPHKGLKLFVGCKFKLDTYSSDIFMVISVYPNGDRNFAVKYTIIWLDGSQPVNFDHYDSLEILSKEILKQHPEAKLV